MVKIQFKKNVRRESRAEVRRLADEYGITDAGGLLLLAAFADADTLERNAEDQVHKDGLTFKDRWGQIKSHPLLPTIRDARAQRLAALKALNLDLEPLRDKPGKRGG